MPSWPLGTAEVLGLPLLDFSLSGSRMVEKGAHKVYSLSSDFSGVLANAYCSGELHFDPGCVKCV